MAAFAVRIPQPPMQDDLIHRYHQLRHQLDAAYAAAVWDGPRIDHIAQDMLGLERSLVAAGVVETRPQREPGLQSAGAPRNAGHDFGSTSPAAWNAGLLNR